MKHSWQQVILFGLGGLILLYAVVVLVHAGNSYDLGIRSILTPTLVGDSKYDKELGNINRLRAGDKIVKVGNLPRITRWADLLQAPRKVAQSVPDSGPLPSWLERDAGTGKTYVQVEFERDGQALQTWCELRRVPLEEMIPSVLWLFLKGLLFVIGALVYWKRPNDEAALRFYILCVVTVGAFIGGYHWTQIVTEPALIVVFIVCAILLPVASLHFYLVFPRKKPLLQSHPRLALLGIYGIPLCNLLGLLGFYASFRAADSDLVLRQNLPWLIYLTFGIATLWYMACIFALIHSWLTVQDPIELKQVRCVLFGIVLSMFPVGLSLYIFFAEQDAFVAGAVTWPMFIASALISLAFAVGITRYRLMELDTIINSSLGYFVITFLAGLMYYGVVFVGTLFYNRFMIEPTLPAALTVSTTALLFVVALDLARVRLKKTLDRRFSRNKSQLDQTLQQLSAAVSQLVDPPVLAQRLLTTIADALGVACGAVFLRQDGAMGYRLCASRGATAFAQEIPLQDPLVETLKTGLGLETSAAAEGAGSAAQKQLRAVGAEVAQPLMHDGAVVAILLLGPKETPYRAEDWTLLSAFAQITVVALESAAQHRAIDQLNRELQAKVDKIAEQQRRILTLQTQLRQTSAEKVVHKIEPARPIISESGDVLPVKPTGIVGSSGAISQLLSVVRKVAATDAVVLLRGESGTGKELLARAVHESSPRAGKPYVKVHCAALSPLLLESELFGHVKGAFTGAHRDKIGRFESASGGTLFLDEIGDVTLDVQTKLLRFLQEKTYERVGSSDTVTADVRIVAATHQNLEELIRRGRFREDLFYRLNVFPIQVPPLRRRREDIPELVMYFVHQASERCRKTLLHLEDDGMAALKAYDWPGNIRELENVIERAVVIAEGDTLRLQDLPSEIIQSEADLAFDGSDGAFAAAEGDAPALSAYRSERVRFEREQVLRALNSANGNKSEAARILGVARSTLVSRLKKLGLV